MNADRDILHGPPFEYDSQYSSIGKFIFDRLKKDPEFVGQIEADTGEEYTFAKILDRSVRLALWFRENGIAPGDVVCYITHNHRDVIIVLYATFFIGAILSAWDVLLTDQDIVHFMDQTKPKIIICSKDVTNSVQRAAEELGVAPIFVVHGESSGFVSFEDTLQIHSKTNVDHFQCTEVEENDVALFICTSGTSALPKIMQRTHKSMLISAQIMQKRRYIGSVFMSFSPLCWVSGLHDAIMGPTVKIQRVVPPYFDEELAWKWIEQYQVKWIALNPPNLLRMIYCDAVSKYDISSLEMIAAAGRTLRAWDYKKFDEITPIGCRLFQGYGTTETSGAVATVLMKMNIDPGSCGTLVPGVSAKIIDPSNGRTISPYKVGELCLKRLGMFTGYYNTSVQTKAALDSEGWFHTGDLAMLNKQGELLVIDRLKDIIYVDGSIIAPSELEAILAKHPGVKCVGVVGKRVSSNMEHPVAFVVKTFGSNVTEAELCSFFKEQDPAEAKQLRGGVRFVDQIPRSASGKIQRWKLKEMLEQEP